MLASNVEICYMILIGMTDLFLKRHEGRLISEYKAPEIDPESAQSIESAVGAEAVHRIRPDDFVFENPHSSIDEFEISKSDSITITEYAPGLFRKIRQEIITDKAIYESLIPSVNYSGIFNF